MNVICTIITGNYACYALALHDSILKINPNQNFAVFVSEGQIEVGLLDKIKSRPNFFLFDNSNFEDNDLGVALFEKYKSKKHDAYRWSMKPVFIKYLLENSFDEVIYVDSDIYFFNDYSFLFDQLKKHNLLLSPHWRSSVPGKDVDNFKLNFLDGIYNGGFIGASSNGIDALDYWANLCLFNCEVNRNEGFYDDQRYLDILPTRFEGVSHIKHKGCNVANWNQIDCKRVMAKTGKVLINGVYPIVFIHFTNSFFEGVLIGEDKILLPYLETYNESLLKYSDVDAIKNFFKRNK